MKHRTEEELIGYRDGEQKNREEIAMHLKECGECRSEMERIEARGILFKVRVVNQDLREREKAAQPSPTQEKSGVKERNKV